MPLFGVWLKINGQLFKEIVNANSKDEAIAVAIKRHKRFLKPGEIVEVEFVMKF